MNHHILIAILSLGLNLGPSPTPLQLTSLSTGVKDSRQVFIGIENKFKVEDSGVVEMIYHPSAKLDGNTLKITPQFMGPLALRFVRNGDTLDMEFQVKVLGLAQARPTVAQNKTISKKALLQDSTVTLEVFSEDDYYKGFKLVRFVGSINSSSFTCDTSFCTELMEAVRQTTEGSLLKITAFELIQEETGRSIKIRCNTPFTITQ